MIHIFHKWKKVYDDACIQYFECETCCKRKYKKLSCLAKPIDYEWLNHDRRVLHDFGFYINARLRKWQQRRLLQMES